MVLMRSGTSRLLLWGLERLSPFQQPHNQTCLRLLSNVNTHSDHVHDVVGDYTAITRRLWLERLQWTPQTLAEAQAQVQIQKKPPTKAIVKYSMSSDSVLQQQYRNPWGFVRMGELLEDLDSLAGNVAFEHCHERGSPFRPPLLVTASVDAIHLRHSIPADKDLTMSGQVVWTGRSSLDIRMELHQDGVTDPSLVALFSFVALDPITQKATPIHQLVPSSREEQQLFVQRQQLADERRVQRQAQTAGAAPGPSPEAQQWVQGLQAEARLLADLPGLAPGDAVLMGSTALSNSFICQPQQRNMHGRIFGGFLMRRAFELAFATTYLFAGARPMLKDVDEITFRKPVDVGDLLRLRSRVLHAAMDTQTAGRGRLYVEVVATVTQPEMQHSYITNTFDFVFEVDLPSGRQLKRVLPGTAEEASRLAECYVPNGVKS